MYGRGDKEIKENDNACAIRDHIPLPLSLETININPYLRNMAHTHHILPIQVSSILASGIKSFVLIRMAIIQCDREVKLGTVFGTLH